VRGGKRVECIYVRSESEVDKRDCFCNVTAGVGVALIIIYIGNQGEAVSTSSVVELAALTVRPVMLSQCIWTTI
jgi:hypothetical protein